MCDLYPEIHLSAICDMLHFSGMFRHGLMTYPYWGKCNGFCYFLFQ